MMGWLFRRQLLLITCHMYRPRIELTKLLAASKHQYLDKGTLATKVIVKISLYEE
jgi:hypothetical protein